MRLLCLIIVSLLFSISLSAQEYPLLEEFKDEFDEAFFEATGSSKSVRFESIWMNSMKRLNKIIQSDSTSFEAFFLRGKFRGLVQDWNGRLSDYDKALSINPNFENAFRQRAAALAHQNLYSKALEDITSAIELSPSKGWNYFIKAEIHLKAGDTTQACLAFSDAIGRGYYTANAEMEICK